MTATTPSVPASVPPLVPVAIVGAGPVGLTVALTLSKQGVPCVLLEEKDEVCTGSRALGMSRRTLEIWDAVRAVASIQSHGKTWDGGRTFWRDEEVLRFQMPDDPRSKFRPMLNLQQCHTERYLHDAAADRPEIDVRWTSRVTGVRRFGSHVELDVTTPQGRQVIRAAHVVACDGAKSTLRALLGLRLQGSTHDASYLIADIKLDSTAPMERRCWFDPPSNPGSTVLMHGQPDQVWRLDYQLASGEDAAEAQRPERVKQRIADHLAYIGERGDWSLEWVSVYRAHSRCLDDFRHGRIFFAGDAAHLMPIFGIRGLNSGVEDGWNLGWKLGFVHRGLAGDTLLDSYSEERRQVFLENAAMADRNAWFMTPPNAGAQLIRDAVLQVARSHAGAGDIINPRQASYVPLRRSSLLTPDDARATFSGGPSPGEVVPNLRLAGTRPAWLQGRLGRGWTLLLFADTIGAADALAHSLTPLTQEYAISVLSVVDTEAPGDAAGAGHVIADPQGDLRASFDAQHGTVYLVRPDHNIAARWRSLEVAEVKAALARGTGACTTAHKGPPSDDPALPSSSAEKIYRTLGGALAASAPDEQPALLAKLLLRLALHIDDPQAVQDLIEPLAQPARPSAPSGH